MAMSACRKPDRDNGFSAVRLIATLLVFCCHALEKFGAVYGMDAVGMVGTYCSVGVPMFLSLSGYLYGRRSYEGTGERLRMYGRMRKILYDFLVYCFLFVVPVNLLLSAGAPTVRAVLYTMVGSYQFRNLAHFWYIPYILLCYLITPLLDDLKSWMRGASRGRLPIFLGLEAGLCLLIYLLCKVYASFFDPVYIVCYLIAFFLPELERWERVSKGRLLAIGAVPCAAAMAAKIYLKNILRIDPEKIAGGGIISLFYDLTHILLGLVLFLLIYVAYHSLSRDRLPRGVRSAGARLLCVSDRYSYDFYIVHMMYVKGVLSVIGTTGSVVADFAAALALTLLSAFALRLVCKLLASAWGRVWKARFI